MVCPNCGAEIGNNTSCEFCGTQITLDMQRTQEQLNKSGCPKCHSTNIQFKRENQGEVRGKNSKHIIHKTVGFCKDCGHTWFPTDVNQENNSVDTDIHKTESWIFIFPVPLTILMLRKKEMKPTIKYSIIAIAWIVYLIIGLTGDSTNENSNITTDTESTPITSVSSETTIVTESSSDNLLSSFTITPETKGEYGFEITLNAGTEFEETQIVYHIPAGTYSVTNLGEYQGQIQACSDKTIVNDDGWEEPENLGQVSVIKPNETIDFTIEDGYYLEVHLNGNLEFKQK